MEEKREIKQIKKYDEDGKLEYVIIPNYRKCDYFMTVNEIRFYKFLVKVIATIKEKNNHNLEVYPQVAINRIIQQNNRREYELNKELFGKNIDFTIFDKDKNEVICCIELDGPEHKTDPNRIERDKIINKAFESSDLKLIRQPHINNDYDMKKYVEVICECINK